MKTIFSQLNWDKGNGLLPAIIQDAESEEVLMLGFMNRAALKKTLETKKVWFYSRTKKRLWMKGETSGFILKVINISFDCDRDTILITAIPTGPVCHTGQKTCFQPFSPAKRSNLRILRELFTLIKERKRNMPKDSYTTLLFQKGLSKICEKVAEESGEVLRAAKRETKKRLIEESVDLLYHFFVLLVAKKISLTEVLQEMVRRRK